MPPNAPLRNSKLIDYYRSAPLKNRLICRYREVICPSQPVLSRLPSQGTMLDLGCGTGLMLMLAAEQGLIHTGQGIDLSTQSIATATQAATRASQVNHDWPAISFSACEHTEQWPEQLFDAVTLIDVLHHVPPNHQIDFLSQAAKRLKPGGTLIYKDMCTRPRWRALGNRLHDLALAQQWINYLPLTKVCQWAESENLTIESVTRYARLWYGHELLILTKPVTL